jgi:hypothetical protein
LISFKTEPGPAFVTVAATVDEVASVDSKRKIQTVGFVVPVPAARIASCVIALPPAVAVAVAAAVPLPSSARIAKRISPLFTAAVVVAEGADAGFAETADVPISVTVAATAG